MSVTDPVRRGLDGNGVWGEFRLSLVRWRLDITMVTILRLSLPLACFASCGLACSALSFERFGAFGEVKLGIRHFDRVGRTRSARGIWLSARSRAAAAAAVDGKLGEGLLHPVKGRCGRIGRTGRSGREVVTEWRTTAAGSGGNRSLRWSGSDSSRSREGTRSRGGSSSLRSRRALQRNTNSLASR
jgi:hypothetical protein